MVRDHVIAIDQSTQGTKAVLFAPDGRLVAKVARPHAQIVHDNGFVEHDPLEIAANVELACRELLDASGIEPQRIACLGISNQRETCLAWDRASGAPLYHAIVWQCSRAKNLCAQIAAERAQAAELVERLSGMRLSPYFSAGKIAWLLRNVPAVQEAARAGTLAVGTIDSWVLWRLTQGRVFATEPSNACRTQLFDISRLSWSDELCELFGVPLEALPTVRPSDSVFGSTTVGGLFAEPIPICGMLGDSQAALMGQGCREPGQVKATYGTGSSVMMQLGDSLRRSAHGLVTSVAWEMDGQRCYVLEGNLNYTGAVVSWMHEEARLIMDPADAEVCARRANPADRAYFVPAFTGLGAPWWDDEATGLLTGVTRTTGHDEIVKACLECIAYQIGDVVDLMGKDAGFAAEELRVDGGPTANGYLMQFQSDVCGVRVDVSSVAELSAAGVAFVAGHTAGIFDHNVIFDQIRRTAFDPMKDAAWRTRKVAGWHAALKQAMTHDR